MYRIRIRTALEHGASRWIIGGTRYSRARTHARAEQLRRQGFVVHVDDAAWYR